MIETQFRLKVEFGNVFKLIFEFRDQVVIEVGAQVGVQVEASLFYLYLNYNCDYF